MLSHKDNVVGRANYTLKDWHKDTLKDILESMSIPEQRKNDLNWLSRNLGIHNSAHKNYVQAMNSISWLLRHS